VSPAPPAAAPDVRPVLQTEPAHETPREITSHAEQSDTELKWRAKGAKRSTAFVEAEAEHTSPEVVAVEPSEVVRPAAVKPTVSQAVQESGAMPAVEVAPRRAISPVSAVEEESAAGASRN